MPYPYPADIVVLADACIAKIQGVAAALGIEGVSYGDQDRIPQTPWVCVEPSEKTRELSGAPNMTTNEFEILILIYHNPVQDMSATRREVDQLAYQIEKTFHQDLQLKNGGPDSRVIHGFISRHESGFVQKNNTLYRAARLTYSGKNKTSLPEN